MFKKIKGKALNEEFVASDDIGRERCLAPIRCTPGGVAAGLALHAGQRLAERGRQAIPLRAGRGALCSPESKPYLRVYL